MCSISAILIVWPSHAHYGWMMCHEVFSVLSILSCHGWFFLVHFAHFSNLLGKDTSRLSRRRPWRRSPIQIPTNFLFFHSFVYPFGSIVSVYVYTDKSICDNNDQLVYYRTELYSILAVGRESQKCYIEILFFFEKEHYTVLYLRT